MECRDLFGHCSLLPHLEFRPGKPSGSRGKLGQLNSTHLVVSPTLPFSSSLPSLFLFLLLSLPQPPEYDDVATICYTSGTTGKHVISKNGVYN